MKFGNDEIIISVVGAILAIGLIYYMVKRKQRITKQKKRLETLQKSNVRMASRLSMYKSNHLIDQQSKGVQSSVLQGSDMTRVDVSNGTRNYSTGYNNNQMTTQEPIKNKSSAQFSRRATQPLNKNLVKTNSVNIQTNQFENQINKENAKVVNKLTDIGKILPSPAEPIKFTPTPSTEIIKKEENTQPFTPIKVNPTLPTEIIKKDEKAQAITPEIPPVDVNEKKISNIVTRKESEPKKITPLNKTEEHPAKLVQQAVVEKKMENKVETKYNESLASADESVYDDRSHMQNKAYNYLMKNSPDKYIDYLLKQENLSCIQYRDDEEENKVKPVIVTKEKKEPSSMQNKNKKGNKATPKQKIKSLEDEGEKTLKKNSLDDFKKKLTEKFKHKDKPNEPGEKKSEEKKLLEKKAEEKKPEEKKVEEKKVEEKKKTGENSMAKFKKKITEKFKNKIPPKEPVNANAISDQEPPTSVKEIREITISPSLDKFKQKIKNKFKNKERPKEPESDTAGKKDTPEDKRAEKLKMIKEREKDRKLNTFKKHEESGSLDKFRNKLKGQFNDKIIQEMPNENRESNKPSVPVSTFNRTATNDRFMPDRPFNYSPYDKFADLPPLPPKAAFDYQPSPSAQADFDYRYRKMVGNDPNYPMEFQNIFTGALTKSPSLNAHPRGRVSSKTEFHDTMRAMDRIAQDTKLMHIQRTPSDLNRNR